MNKYQEFAIKELVRFHLWDGKKSSMDCCQIDKGSLILNQYEDITVTDYMLIIDYNNDGVKKSVNVQYYENDAWKNPNELYKEKAPLIRIDFNKPIKKIRIQSVNKLFEDVELSLKYVFADKEAYYAKKKEEEEANKAKAVEELIKKMDIKISTGDSLANIYFSPVSDNYATAKIELYTATGRFEQHHGSVIHDGWKPKLLGGTIERLIGKYTVDEGMFFKAINGLAKGVYGIKLIQIDSNGKAIIESNFEFFVIR